MAEDFIEGFVTIEIEADGMAEEGFTDDVSAIEAETDGIDDSDEAINTDAEEGNGIVIDGVIENATDGMIEDSTDDD